ncbi:MAG TPA: four helix bundle protein [Patescibacteria group bacterium]|nr:four helix bundle protein [Patescibacteria group bacterium]
MSNTFLSKTGNYQNLKSFQNATLIFDLTVDFTQLYIPSSSRTVDQMVQAARSGRQNIAEGSKTSSTSKMTELKLVNVARASLEELLLDYEDFLRQKGLQKWGKADPRALQLRKLAYDPRAKERKQIRQNKTYRTHESYTSYRSYWDYLVHPETAGNCLVTLINQTNYLLDQQVKVLESGLVKHGEATERLKWARNEFLKEKLLPKKTPWDLEMQSWIARRYEAGSRGETFTEKPPDFY